MQIYSTNNNYPVYYKQEDLNTDLEIALQLAHNGKSAEVRNKGMKMILEIIHTQNPKDLDVENAMNEISMRVMDQKAAAGTLGVFPNA